MTTSPIDAIAALARLGDAYAEPAKTHDLSVSELPGGTVVVAAENLLDGHRAYLPAGIAQDLGRVLAVLTPAQRQLLVDDLTGGAK